MFNNIFKDALYAHVETWARSKLRKFCHFPEVSQEVLKLGPPMSSCYLSGLVLGYGTLCFVSVTDLSNLRAENLSIIVNGASFDAVL